MLVVGAKEMEEGKVAVRSRKEGDLGAVALDEFIAKLHEEVDNKVCK